MSSSYSSIRTLRVLGVILLSLVTLSVGQVTSNPACPLCGPNGGSEITNPDAIVNVTALNFTGLFQTSCSNVATAGTDGTFTPEQCTILQSLTEIQTACGCPVAATFVCNICNGDATATISNPTAIVDGSFIGTGISTTSTCQQVFDAGLAGFINSTQCPIATTNTELQTTCGCSNIYVPDTNSTEPPLIDVIQNQTDLSTLYTAIETADLVDALASPNVSLTIFAPVNTAFDALGKETLDKLFQPDWILHLQDVLFYHTVNLKFLAADIPAGETPAVMLNGENTTVTNVDGKVTVSYPTATEGTTVAVNVIETDLLASNGVTHKIDGVLLPLFVFLSVNDRIKRRPKFNILQELITLAYPDGIPVSNGAITVLAPTDDAFIALGNATLDTLKDPANVSLLQAILQNHLIAQVIPSIQLKDGNQYTAASGITITITQKGDSTSPSSYSWNGVATNEPDILANDGIVYAIDGVILDEGGSVSSSPSLAPGTSDSPSSLPAVTVSEAPSSIPIAVSEAPSSAPIIADLSDAPSAVPVSLTSEAPSSAPFVGDRTVADILETTPDLSILWSATQTADLVGALDGNVAITLFAPVNSSFIPFDPVYLAELLSPPWILHLQNFLSYHAINVAASSAQIPVGTNTAPMLNGENITIVKTDDGAISLAYPSINCSCSVIPVDAPVEYISVNVISADLAATNGYVHEIDGVLLPSFVFTNVLTIINRQFPTLFELGALVYPNGLPNGTYTVLAPTEDAFAKLGNQTITALKDPANLDQLTSIINNHIVATVTPTVSLEDGDTITADSGLVIDVSVSQVIRLNDAFIVDPDILAVDGIVQGIDGVLLAPVVSTAPIQTSSDTPSSEPAGAPSIIPSIVPIASSVPVTPTFAPSSSEVPTAASLPSDLPSSAPVGSDIPSGIPSAAPIGAPIESSPTDRGDEVEGGKGKGKGKSKKKVPGKGKGEDSKSKGGKGKGKGKGKGSDSKVGKGKGTMPKSKTGKGKGKGTEPKSKGGKGKGGKGGGKGKGKGGKGGKRRTRESDYWDWW